MIDGIKIDVNSLNGSNWLNNKLLHFHTYTSVDTGELLDGTIVAKYRGLKFFITKSTKYENRVYYSVRGSLHKYFNKGKHNANDFTFHDLQGVIKELEQKFNIEPKTSILRNLEFGVNINTLVTTKELLKSLVCYGNYLFGTLRVDRIVVGKSIIQQRNDLKIYDKSKQFNLPIQNLTRVEIAVKKMAFLKKYCIVHLSDLQDVTKVKPLGNILLSYWNDVIYYDKKIDWKHLTEFERKKTLYYATPRNWVDYQIKQRYRAKKHFKELMHQFSTSTTHKDVYNLITEKWNDLTAEICPQINHDLKSENENQNVHILTVRIHGYSMDKTTSKKTINISTENTPKKRYNSNHKKRECKNCKTNISHKRTGTKYCSKKCNNKVNGMKRTKNRKKRIQNEKEDLKKLLQILPKNKLTLVISYKINSDTYSDNLHQSEIHTTINWVKKIVLVSITGSKKNKKTIILTSYRARRLINNINQINKNEINTRTIKNQKETSNKIIFKRP